MAKLILIISFIITSSSISAQSYDELVLGDCEINRGKDVLFDPYGNKFVLTFTFSTYRSFSTITKLSPSNDVIWSKGFTQLEPWFDVEANTLEWLNNSLVVSGRLYNMNSTVTGSRIVFISKIDTSGTIQWTNIYNNGVSQSMVVQDDRIYITGTALEGLDRYFFVMSTDTMGNVIWNKKFQHNIQSEGSDIKYTSDGNLIATGSFVNNQQVNHRVGAIKLDTAGNVLWKNYYQFYDDSVNYKFSGGYNNIIESDYDSSYIIQGYYDAEVESARTFLLNLDPNTGQVISNTSYDYSPGTNVSISVDLINTKNGYVVVGQDHFGVFDTDIVAMAVDYSGNPMWARSYGNTSSNWAVGVKETETGFTILGTTESFYPSNNTSEDGYYFELDTLGMAPSVINPTLNVVVDNISPTVAYSDIIVSDYVTIQESFTLTDTIVGGLVDPSLCPFVGLDENELNGMYTVFPNPTSTFISVRIPDSETLKSLTLMNNQGATILFLNEGETEMEFEQLSSGVYFLQITTDAVSVTRKVLVN
jgi:hypothetical protein